MYRLLSIFFFLAMALPMVAENKLSNSKFEHGLAGYLLGDTTNRRFSVPFDLSPYNSGYALTFKALPEERLALYLPEIRLEPNTEYELSFMAKSSVNDLPIIVSEYVRVGGSVGSAGKYFPKFTTEWKKYIFRYKPSGKEPWGGFRIVKNNFVNKIPVDISIAELSLGPADGKKAPESDITASFCWQKFDPRLVPGETMTPQLTIFNKTGTARNVHVAWKLRSSYDNVIAATGNFDFEANPGKSTRDISISAPRYNGIFYLEGVVDNTPFINKVKFAITPKVRVKLDDLPVNLGVNSPATAAAFTPVSDEEMAFFADQGNIFIRSWDNAPPFIWREIEPQDGHFRWDAADRMVEAAERAGLEVLPVLGGMFFTYPDMKPFGKNEPSGHASPLWLYQNSPVVSCPPNMPQFTNLGRKSILPPMKYWDRMVRSIAERYKGRIHYYEVMNEPNLCLTAKQYLPYLENANRILKETDSKNTVVGICATGDFNGHIMEYVDEMLKLGAGNYCDDISFHPYNNLYEDSPNSGETVITAFYGYLKKNNNTRARLWNTELYYLNPASTGGNSANGPIFHPGYLIRRYLLDASQGVKASILVPGSFMLGNVINDNCQADSNSNFFSNSLMPNGNYIASAVFAKLLYKTRFYATENLPGNIRAYKFTGKDKAVAAIFALNMKSGDARELVIPKGAGTFDLRNLFDNPVVSNKDGNWIIPATPIPLYITATSEKALDEVIQRIKLQYAGN